MSNFYWQDGSPYCTACVECDTPAVEKAEAMYGPASGRTRCACCGGDGLTREDTDALADDREQYLRDIGEWEDN